MILTFGRGSGEYSALPWFSHHRAALFFFPAVDKVGKEREKERGCNQTADINRFSWANGLFGQMILDLRERKPYLLMLSYQ